MTYAAEIRRSERDARDLERMYERDRVSAVSAQGRDTVAVYEERRAENERYLAEIAARVKRSKRRKRKGRAA